MISDPLPKSVMIMTLKMDGIDDKSDNLNVEMMESDIVH